MTTAADNIHAGRLLWSVEQGDATTWLASLPVDSVDLIVTSPPYVDARTYGLAWTLKGQAWVDWMVGIVKAASLACKGLIAIVCEGKTKDRRYDPTPFLLAADLHRAGYNLRKPCVFHRHGIPGSGGTDWWRNDWEVILCITRPGKLPWSDPTACGHPPKYQPGGAMSNRTKSGKRVDNGEPNYLPPKLANPGNVIKCKVGGGHMGSHHAHDNEAPYPESLVEPFVRSFSPPDGVVCDPFCGSGTTGAVAVRHGRRFIGCDIRQSQVDLAAIRIWERGWRGDTGRREHIAAEDGS